MHANDSPEVVDLFCCIAKLVARALPFEGTIVRSAGTRYASEQDFLSGEGAARFGGRWNRPGILAIYASLDIETAIQEAYQPFLSYGFPLSAIRPRVLAGINAKLAAVLDLTDSGIRRKLGFTLHTLLDEDWAAIQATGEESWTQAIGRGCRAAGLEAVLAPSARKTSGKNLIIFPDRLRPGSVIQLLNPEELPPTPFRRKR